MILEAEKKKPFFTVEEAAEILRTCRTTVRRMIKAGKLRFSKPGQKYLILRSSLESHLKRNGNLDNRGGRRTKQN